MPYRSPAPDARLGLAAVERNVARLAGRAARNARELAADAELQHELDTPGRDRGRTPVTRRGDHVRLTFAQRRLLEIARSFGPTGATQREIALRYKRLAGRTKRPRR